MLRPRTKQAERTNYPFPCPLVLLGWPKGSFKLFYKMLQKTGKSFLVNPVFGSSMDWIEWKGPTLDWLYSVFWFKCQSYLETPWQTCLEIKFKQVPELSVAQLSWHINLTIPSLWLCEVAEVWTWVFSVRYKATESCCKYCRKGNKWWTRQAGHRGEVGALASSGSRKIPDAGDQEKGTDAPKTKVRLSPGLKSKGGGLVVSLLWNMSQSHLLRARRDG